MYQYLRHAQAVRPLKHVLLGLDPYHLAPGLSTTRPDFDPSLLLDPDSATLLRWLRADLRLLTSLDTVKASLETLRTQNSGQPNWFGPDGQRLGEVFFRQVDGNFKSLDPRGYFDMIDRREVGYQTDWMVDVGRKRLKPRAEPPIDSDQTSLAYVRRIVEFCQAHQIDLRIAITPAHAHTLEITAARGAWKELENQKAALMRMVAQVQAAQTQPQAPIPVFDFGGYSSITQEPLPPLGSRSEMQFYWDGSHFKQVVGDYVLDRVYGVLDPAHQPPADFGVALNIDTIDGYLAQQRVRQADYTRRFPDDTAALRALVAVALQRIAP